MDSWAGQTGGGQMLELNALSLGMQKVWDLPGHLIVEGPTRQVAQEVGVQSGGHTRLRKTEEWS